MVLGLVVTAVVFVVLFTLEAGTYFVLYSEFVAPSRSVAEHTSQPQPSPLGPSEVFPKQRAESTSNKQSQGDADARSHDLPVKVLQAVVVQ